MFWVTLILLRYARATHRRLSSPHSAVMQRFHSSSSTPASHALQHFPPQTLRYVAQQHHDLEPSLFSSFKPNFDLGLLISHARHVLSLSSDVRPALLNPRL